MPGEVSGEKRGRTAGKELLAVCLLIAVVSIFPVRQASINRANIRQLQDIHEEVLEVQESNRILAAEIAELANPDRVSGIAEHVLQMRRADEEDLTLVRIQDQE